MPGKNLLTVWTHTVAARDRMNDQLAVEVIDTDLGYRSYVAHDGYFAIVVDPQRDLERIEAG